LACVTFSTAIPAWCTSTLTAGNSSSTTKVSAFLAILPRIKTHSRISFRAMKCQARQEGAIAEMVALAWRWFVWLVEEGQAGEFQEATQGPDAGHAELPKDEVKSEEHLFEEGQSRWRFHECEESWWRRGTSLPLLPRVEGGVRDAGRSPRGATGQV
jgi:hypothetical protein